MFDNPYFYTAVVIGVIAAIAALIVKFIPDGYEDDRGFHYGREDGDEM
jgi:hypothetical protein